MKKQVIFISGLGGTGKSSLVWHFMEHPVKGYSFYDFDKGKYKTPPYNENPLDWRTNMTKWWLEVADRESTKKENTAVILGFSLYPQDILALPEAAVFENNIHFGHLRCDAEERKSRLEARGDAHHWGGHKDWYDEFFAKMKAVGAQDFDTTQKTIDQSATEILGWLKGL